MFIIGGIGRLTGRDNLLLGTSRADVLFGDPYTGGNEVGVPDTGRALAAGVSGRDQLRGLEANDELFGDAWLIQVGAAAGMTCWREARAWTGCSATLRF